MVSLRPIGFECDNAFVAFLREIISSLQVAFPPQPTRCAAIRGRCIAWTSAKLTNRRPASKTTTARAIRPTIGDATSSTSPGSVASTTTYNTPANIRRGNVLTKPNTRGTHSATTTRGRATSTQTKNPSSTITNGRETSTNATREIGTLTVNHSSDTPPGGVGLTTTSTNATRRGIATAASTHRRRRFRLAAITSTPSFANSRSTRGRRAILTTCCCGGTCDETSMIGITIGRPISSHLLGISCMKGNFI